MSEEPFGALSVDVETTVDRVLAEQLQGLKRAAESRQP